MVDNFTPKLKAEERSALILSAAVNVANEKGLSEVTFQNVAETCVIKTRPRTVSHYFKISELRREVVADKRSNEKVRNDAIAMGINVK